MTWELTTYEMYHLLDEPGLFVLGLVRLCQGSVSIGPTVV